MAGHLRAKWGSQPLPFCPKSCSHNLKILFKIFKKCCFSYNVTSIVFMCSRISKTIKTKEVFYIQNSYRASIIEIVILFTEQFSTLATIMFRSMQKPGGFAIGRGAYSLLKNETTSTMVCRSMELSCTQRSPMLMNRDRIEVEEGFPIVGSINSKLRPFLHNSQTCFR
jgi:hypothetical protein